MCFAAVRLGHGGLYRFVTEDWRLGGSHDCRRVGVALTSPSLFLSFSLARASLLSLLAFSLLTFLSFFLLEGGGEVGRDSAKGGLDPHHVEGKTKPFDTLRKKRRYTKVEATE